jgi:hypothetical protein
MRGPIYLLFLPMRYLYIYLGLALLLAGPAAAQAQKPLNDTVKVNKEQYNLFHPTPRKYMRPMVPDRPGITESPYSVDAGHFQYEADGLRLLARREGTTLGRDWYVNHALAKIGLTNKTDFQVQFDTYTSTHIYDETDPSVSQRAHGAGDLTLRLKHTLVGDDDSRWALGVIGYVELPTGGMGDGGYEPGLVVPAVFQINKDWSAGGQLEANLFFDREEDQHFVQLTPTLTTDYQFNKVLEAFVEVVGYRDLRESQWRGSVNLGPQFDIGDNLQFDFGAHLPLTHGVDHEFFVGFSFRR